MEHLALEVFDLPTREVPNPTGSKYASLQEDDTITITDTSEIFGSGDVWSHTFRLNAAANAHIFGTASDLHGSRLHEQVDKRRARLWVEGLPLFLGYLKLGDEVEVDEDGFVDVSFEGGQKTFDELIEGISAREVSVGDVPIGIALNRKRTVVFTDTANIVFTLDGLNGYTVKDPRLQGVDSRLFKVSLDGGPYIYSARTPYAQRWPKFVKSHGKVLDGSWNEIQGGVDFTNIQSPYDASHPFCNINICYPLKVNDKGEEKATRGYTVRLARGKGTTDGGDNQTRYNNAPNFYLLHFIDRLFKDLKIHVDENQALAVEDLRRVFMLNYGCFYEEIEDSYNDDPSHGTPQDKMERYGQYYIPIVESEEGKFLVEGFSYNRQICVEDIVGKVLLRDLTVEKENYEGVLLKAGSVEGVVKGHMYNTIINPYMPSRLDIEGQEDANKAYSAYLAYATGENYPNVEISEVIEAMKSMFGVRFLFSDDYKRVRIVLLRNVFRSSEVQEIACEITGEDTKVENATRGFRMTYGKGTEDTNFYYKGFNDLFPRAAKTWKDTTDKHDYSQWDLDAEYGDVKKSSSAMNRKCYVTPVNGNAYVTKVDEEENVLFPSLYEVAGFMDAEDGDCSQEGETVEEVQVGASPLVMNEINNTYASLFGGEMKAPSPDDYEYAQEIATFARATVDSIPYDDTDDQNTFRVTGQLDVYISEGFRIRMEDNYGIGNSGTPFDEADPGLCFGIMRSSGPDARVAYGDDVDDKEGNDTWEIVPGDGAIDHCDTCDGYGNEWDYDGSDTVTAEEAPAKLAEMFPDSDAPFNDQYYGYVTETTGLSLLDGSGNLRFVLIASAYSRVGKTVFGTYLTYLRCLTLERLLQISGTERHIVVEVDSSAERGRTLVQLCYLAYGSDEDKEPMTIDNGVGSLYGRLSLKLRAEKPNPYYDPNSTDPDKKDRYLAITDKNLRQRGLADQLYKEYSFFVRSARIVRRPVKMELAQLLAIDKTKWVVVGDVKGLIRKMEYSVSNRTGLGIVTMEIMYI